AAGFARRRGLLPDALRRLARNFPAAGLFLLAAHAFGRRAQTSADALGLRLLLGLALLVGLRLRVELAANQLDLRDFRAVALAEADAQQTRVAARPIREPRRDGVEQLRHDVTVLQIVHDEPPGVQHPGIA